jgi:hypothetical protein
MNKTLIVGILAVAILGTIGIGAALDQPATTEEDNNEIDCCGNCYGSCDGTCTGTGECDGTGNQNMNGLRSGGYGPGNGEGNCGLGPRDGTGYGCGGCRRT